VKTELPKNRAGRMINHGPVVLVTSGGREKPNIITIAWVMPVRKDPPMLAVSVGRRRHSHGLIVEHGEFAVCVPPASLLDQVWQCGRVSGASVDKFEATGLRPSPSREIGTPGIEQCVANIECRLASSHDAGDHTIFVGEVLRAEVEQGLLDEQGTLLPDRAATLHHLGSNRFAETGRRLVKKD
jgi:flavin reductase (DIM6/NTAB) family NADH-FMN oxidoreductase RutF